MSIHVMNLVWKYYRRGGSEKLALLALADWCNDEGGRLNPSIRTVSRKICTSESQARRIVHKLIDEGVLTVVGNHNGGHKGQTCRYRINLDHLTADSHATASADATPSTDATPSVDACPPLHGCASPLAPMPANTLLTIKEPSVGAVAPNAALEILQYLNAKTGKNFQPVKTNLDVIAARIKEGATAEQCRAVIDAKTAEWSNDDKMRPYLRPLTLFRPANFAQYAGEVPTRAPAETVGGAAWE